MSLIERLTRPLRAAWLRPVAARSLQIVHILLAPQQLSLVLRQGRHVIAGSAQQIALVNPGGHWQAGLDALRALLNESAKAWAGLPLEISLSGRWSHMVVAPWSDALLSEPGAAHFLQSQMTALYGDAARGWHVVGDDAPYGETRTVCGIDATLLQALKELADDSGHACRVIEPLLCTALRSLSAEESRARAAALALIEPGRITMAALDRGRIVAVQSQPATSAWRQELPQAWQRWTLRVPELAGIEHVAVVDPGATPGAARGAAAQLVADTADTLAPRFRIVDHPFRVGLVEQQPDLASSGAAA